MSGRIGAGEGKAKDRQPRRQGRRVKADTHPHKAGRKPSLLIVDLAPPPILVGSIQDFDDVASLKCQLPVGHGDVIPYCLSTNDGISSDQLRRQNENVFSPHSGLPYLPLPPPTDLYYFMEKVNILVGKDGGEKDATGSATATGPQGKRYSQFYISQRM